MQKTIVFTSITKNYFAKATVLADSIKRFNPDTEFHVVMAENGPFTDVDIIPGSIDKIVTLTEFADDLDEQWLFMHSLVEVCTTLKPLYLNRLLQEGWQKIHYFDPDMRVFSDISVVMDELAEGSIGLTPHITSPDFDLNSILINEISAAKHGVFNLGFLAVKNSQESRLFARWWADRVTRFGFSETFMGTFTDQKICDFTPCYFSSFKVLRHPGFNVAHWNLNDRQVQTIDDEIFVGTKKLVFYHFSAYDSGIGRQLINQRDDNESATLLHIWDTYQRELELAGEQKFASCVWPLTTFANGFKITKAMRLYYRQNPFVRQLFPSPYSHDSEALIHFWLQDNRGAKLEDQLDQFEAQMQQYRFPAQQERTENMLTTLAGVDATKIERVFIYGGNEYGAQLLKYCKIKFAGKRIYLLDQQTSLTVEEELAWSPDSFTYSRLDLVIICGVAARECMINTIQSRSDSSPIIL